MAAAVDQVTSIRLNSRRPGRVTKSKVTRNLFGVTKEDQTKTDLWLKNELKQVYSEDRKKLECLGLDPDTEMPANTPKSRWEMSIIDARVCPNIYRTKEIISKFVHLSTRISPESSVVSDRAEMDLEQSSSETPARQYKQTTITDFLPKRRLLFRTRRKHSSSPSTTQTRQNNDV